MKQSQLFCAMLLVALLAGPAHAQKACRLERFSEIPITTLPDGRFTVPVTLEGRTMNFLVDTGGVSAVVSRKQAMNLVLSHKTRFHRTPNHLLGVAGNKMELYVNIGKFSLGRLTGTNIPVYINERPMSDFDGILAPDMMRRFDVDIDLARGTLSLFSQNHCPGQVVHWTRSGYVVLPMNVLLSGHIEVPVTIDGKKFTALLDTGAQHSIISMSAARALGVSENSPDLKPITDKNARYKAYDYPFKLLDFDGVAVSNPRFQVVSDNFLPSTRIDLIVGVSILRRLHLYIAYGEEKLYITPALAN